MKKKAIYLMIACLSLIVSPELAKAGTETPAVSNTEAVIDPAAAKAVLTKVDELKKPHHLFSKREAGTNNSVEKRGGGVVYMSGAALVLIIVLLIILL